MFRFIQSRSFGQLVREQRIAKKLPLRQVAALLEMDQAILCKIERGQRTASSAHVQKLAQILEIDHFELEKAHLIEKLLVLVPFDVVGLSALEAVSNEVAVAVSKASKMVETQPNQSIGVQ
jgi:HTH-type transcriptional regulator, competence development regulator